MILRLSPVLPCCLSQTGGIGGSVVNLAAHVVYDFFYQKEHAQTVSALQAQLTAKTGEAAATHARLEALLKESEQLATASGLKQVEVFKLVSSSIRLYYHSVPSLFVSLCLL